ncbi:MAG: rRNA maturation RNase YbeY, partial [Gammaproteobacteria bacterium]|nr:rRNA maturation RNase YbeY [Gammaproteobacteria bacterium]
CAPVIKQEARQQGRSAASHWAHMVVHGMLHLQGYDHIDNRDAERMEQLEIDILDQLGFANPYEDITTGNLSDHSNR